MARFVNNGTFAIEFAFRTKLNYYQLLKLEKIAKNEIEDVHNIDEKITEVQEAMRERNFHTLIEPQWLCCGTQLMNSVLGFLVFPQQQFFRNTPEDEIWERLPILRKYIYSNDSEVYINTYIREKIFSPKNVLKHMKNSISHKRIMFYPETNDYDEIQSLVFKDENIIKITDRNNEMFQKYQDKITKNGNGQEIIKQNFKLCVKKDEFDELLFEIFDYFVSLQT